jgi:hypothetical protein
MMKAYIAGAMALFLATMAWTAPQAQQAQPPAQPQPAAACLTQYTPMPGHSAAALIAAGHEIKAAVPNGLWLQKDREVFYCNSGRPTQTDPLCWRLREVSAC